MVKKKRSENIKDALLTQRQKSIVVGTLLTDGFIEISPNGQTARIRLEISSKSEQLAKTWRDVLKPFTSDNIEKFQRGRFRKDGSPIEMVRVSTYYHKEFKQFYDMFHDLSKPTGQPRKKTVPLFNNIIQYLDWEMFAYQLMFDGSRKGQGRSMELHLQSFSFEAQSRLCVALYQRLGIKCWPARSASSPSSGKEQFHIIISGFVLDIIIEKVKPFFLQEFYYKIPEQTDRVLTDTSTSPWEDFYQTAINDEYLNKFSDSE